MFPLTPKEFGPIPQSAPHYAAASALYGNHPINPFRGWRVTAGVAAPLSGKAQSLCCNRRQGEVSFPWGGAYACCSDQRMRSIFRGRSEFRGTQFGAKKKKKVKKKKRQRKAQELKSKARGSRCNRPLTLVQAHRFSVEPAVTPRDPLPGAGRTPSSEAFRGVGSSRVAAALGAGQPLALPPLLPCDLKARIFKRCSARRQARRGGSGLFPQASIGGFPRPPRHAARRVSRRGLRSSQVPAGALGEGAQHSPCCEGPEPWLRPLDHP